LEAYIKGNQPDDMPEDAARDELLHWEMTFGKADTEEPFGEVTSFEYFNARLDNLKEEEIDEMFYEIAAGAAEFNRESYDAYIEMIIATILADIELEGLNEGYKAWAYDAYERADIDHNDVIDLDEFRRIYKLDEARGDDFQTIIEQWFKTTDFDVMYFGQLEKAWEREVAW
jgi:hypothetical protein